MVKSKGRRTCDDVEGVGGGGEGGGGGDGERGVANHWHRVTPRVTSF